MSEAETAFARALKRSRITKSRLARLSGVDRSYLVKLAQGLYDVTEEMARRLAPHLPDTQWSDIVTLPRGTPPDVEAMTRDMFHLPPEDRAHVCVAIRNARSARERQ